MKKLTEVVKTHKLETLVKAFYPGNPEDKDVTDEINSHGLLPKPRDEKQFMKRHTVHRSTPNPDSNDHDTFKADNVKVFDRSAHRMGYNAGEDEKAAFKPYDPVTGKTATPLVNYSDANNVARAYQNGEMATVKENSLAGERIKGSDSLVRKNLQKPTGQDFRSDNPSLDQTRHLKQKKSVKEQAYINEISKQKKPTAKQLRRADVEVKNMSTALMDPNHPRNSKWLKKEETEQIDEISKKTLGSYVKKASSDGQSSSFRHGKLYGKELATQRRTKSDAAEAKKEARISANRGKGVDRATDRMTGEFHRRGDKTKKYKGK